MAGFRLRKLIADFRERIGGNVAVLFALSSPIILLAVGGGIELARGYNTSQQLTEVADLACQYASRPSVIEYATTSPGTYTSMVTSFIATSLQSQHFAFTQTNGTPFTFAQGGAANVTLRTTMPTVFAGIVNISTIPITATAHCYDSPSAIQQNVPNGSSTNLVQEGFESSSACNKPTCWYKPDGTVTPWCSHCSIPYSDTQTGTVGYTGTTGVKWYILGYCVETDTAGQTIATVAEGLRLAELDCDNGHGTGGNSSISTSVYLAAGSYELRYNYTGRIDYVDYDPVYICGSTAGDVNWANNTNSESWLPNALRTNQINVYLDANTDGTISHPQHDGWHGESWRQQPDRHVRILPELDRAQRQDHHNDRRLLLAQLRGGRSERFLWRAAR